MMKVTYMSHDGFVVDTDEAILVFDYVHDPAHVVEKACKAHPDKPVIFFISHVLVNNNHFNPGTFEIAQNHRRIYVVSNDLPAKYIPSTLEVAGMSAGDIVEPIKDKITVKAYKTTEKGVCFLVTTASGKKIFHAGQLNIWHMPDESGKQEYQRESEKYYSIVNRIAEDTSEIDVAMMNVNPRISLDFAEGAREFCEMIKVKNFFPMDIDGDSKEACGFVNYLPAHTSGYCLNDPGESVKISD